MYLDRYLCRLVPMLLSTQVDRYLDRYIGIQIGTQVSRQVPMQIGTYVDWYLCRLLLMQIGTNVTIYTGRYRYTIQVVPQVPQYLMKKILILEKGDHGRGANFGTNILKFFSTIFVCLGRQERMWPNSKVYFTSL